MMPGWPLSVEYCRVGRDQDWRYPADVFALSYIHSTLACSEQPPGHYSLGPFNTKNALPLSGACRVSAKYCGTLVSEARDFRY